VARSGGTTTDLVLGRHPVRINVAGEALANIVMPAFAHLRDDRARDPDLRIYVWDADATGIGMVQPLPAEDNWQLQYDRTSEVYTAVERSGRTALVCVRRHASLPAWDRAHPLRRAIATWARAKGLVTVHAATVAEDGYGLLVVGPGGSGKSTTALSWIARGGHSAGDDYILLEATVPPIAHSMFATMRLHLDHAQHFDGLLPAADLVERQDSGRRKATVNMANARPGVLVRQMQILGLVMARIADSGGPRLRALSGQRAMLELMGSSMAQFLQADVDAPAGLPIGFRAMGDLCRTVPCAHLDIAGDPFEIPALLRTWIANLRADKVEASLR
jgi:hypothetical protein